MMSPQVQPDGVANGQGRGRGSGGRGGDVSGSHSTWRASARMAASAPRLLQLVALAALVAAGAAATSKAAEAGPGAGVKVAAAVQDEEHLLHPHLRCPEPNPLVRCIAYYDSCEGDAHCPAGQLCCLVPTCGRTCQVAAAAPEAAAAAADA